MRDMENLSFDDICDDTKKAEADQKGDQEANTAVYSKEINDAKSTDRLFDIYCNFEEMRERNRISPAQWNELMSLLRSRIEILIGPMTQVTKAPEKPAIAA